MKKFTTIKCPKCGYEYLPAEIFYPNSLLGKPKNIVRDDSGKIIYFDGESMNATEEYTCDKCECTFNVFGRFEFESSVNVEHDFSEDYEIDFSDKEEVKDTGLWGND